MNLADDARKLIERTCAEQGLPLTVADPVVLAKVAAVVDEWRGTFERTCAEHGVTAAFSDARAAEMVAAIMELRARRK